MQIEKVFKFVALRGPERTSTRVPPFGPPSDDNSFVDTIRRSVDATRPFERAREDVARAFLVSNRYVPRALEWRRILRLEGPIAERLKEAREIGGTKGADRFRKALGELLKDPLGPNFRLSTFVRSDRFHEMQRNLRNSLFSNIILKNWRFHDRDQLIFWTRLFALLGQIEDDDQFAQLIAGFDRLRPSIPYDIVRATETVRESPLGSQPTSPGLSARDAALSDTKLAFKELSAARAAVKRVLYAKVERFKAEPPPPRVIRKGAVVIDDAEPLPWILKAYDLDAKTIEVLRKHGIGIEGQPGPRIMAEIDAKLPPLHAQMHGLSTVARVAFTRGVPIRTRER